jgi:hypothetical protein
VTCGHHCDFLDKRTLSELDLDIRALRKTKRRSVRGVDPRRQKKLASLNNAEQAAWYLTGSFAKEHTCSIAKTTTFRATHGQSGTQGRTSETFRQE